MYQTVIILLVTMVTTIVTTIITVRFTMTGGVVSQTTKDRLTTKAKMYGVAVVIFLFCSGTAFMLVYNLRKVDPLTRGDVFLIAFYTGAVASWVIALEVFLLLYLSKRKRRDK